MLPGATIHAFEPVRRTFEILRSRVPVGGRIQLHPFGLSDQSAEIEFQIQPDNLENASVLPKTAHLLNPSARFETETCTLRSALQAAESLGVNSVDFLKVDTEGHDWHVLNGFRSWLEAGRIPVIQFEYGMCCIETKKLLCDYYDLLAPHGYRIGKIFPTFVDFRDYHPSHEDFIGPNFLAVHESAGLEDKLH